MPQRPSAPFPTHNQTLRRVGVFAVGIAIGCVLVGILLLSRQMILSSNTQNAPNRAAQGSQAKTQQPDSSPSSQQE